MKKYLISLFVILCAISVILPASAEEEDLCKTQCNEATGTIYDPNNINIDDEIGSGSSGSGNIGTVKKCSLNEGIRCTYTVCGNECKCLADGVDCNGQSSGGEFEIKSCVPDSWSPNMQNIGKERGTCTTPTGTFTYYRCSKGYYAENVEVRADYTEDDIKCTKCPKKDKTAGCSTTKGNGVNTIKECFVEEACTITDDNGQYIFTGECQY